jgi:hypothetical protein
MDVCLDAVAQGAALVVWPVQAIHQPLDVSENFSSRSSIKGCVLQAFLQAPGRRTRPPPSPERMKNTSKGIRGDSACRIMLNPMRHPQSRQNATNTLGVIPLCLVLLARRPRALAVVIARIPAAVLSPHVIAVGRFHNGNCNTRA